MIDNFHIPRDFEIQWDRFSTLDLRTKAVWLFLYSQKGINTNILAIESILGFDHDTVERAVLTVFAIKGGLEC